MTVSRGIDVSHHNVCTDYPAAKAAVDWVYIKVTEGSNFTDPSIDEHYAGFAGKPRGAYHFMRGASTAEVARFVGQVRARAWELPPMLDAEYAGVTSAVIKAFMTEYQRQTGQELTVVYTSKSLLTGACNPSGFITPRTVIWAARYARNSADFSTLGWDHPQLGIYQYWDKGSVPGFAGGIDLDIARVALGTNPAPPAPQTAGEDMADRELKPSANGSVTLTVPTDASQLVISLGWTFLTATKVAFFGSTPANGVNQIKSYGSQRVDAGRPYVLQVPAGALTAEVDYTLAPVAGRDVTGTAGFRK